MKRTLIAAAAVLAAGTAFAQSTVNVYGRVNTSVERQKDGSVSRTVLQDSNSRWGLRGVEDMGGGLKGLFVLESGFNSDTGAGAGNLFGRESWVGLQGNFGRVRLGNMGPSAAYFTTADYVSMHNHDTGTSSDAFYLLTGGRPRLNNAVAYNTPSFGGLVAEVQYGFKETVTGSKNTGVAALNYDRGPLHVGATYAQGVTDLGALGLTFAGGTVGGLLTDTQEWGLRALYELGPVTVGGYYVRNRGNDIGAKFKRDTVRLSAMYTLGASEFHVNAGFADDIKFNNVEQADTSAKQYTVAYNYNLSKRTKMYAFYTKVNNDARARYSSSAEGNDFSSFALGVRHNF